MATARPEIDAANGAWLPGLQHRDAAAIAAAYADSGVFIAGDGTVARGRAAVTRMYATRFRRMRPIRAGAVIQHGLTVLAPTRIAEWGHAWLDLEPERRGDSPTRSEGSYLTVWQREADGPWRIVRNLAFCRSSLRAQSMTKRLQTYETPAITVTFDPNICIHSGACVRGLSAVFDVRRPDWVRPDAASAADVAAQVRRCPSDALQYVLADAPATPHDGPTQPPADAR